MRPDTLHTAFNFAFLKCRRGTPTRCAPSIDATIAALGAVGRPPTWVLSSHDETRLVTRYGRRAHGARGT